jgi:hypothetical protein
MGTGEVAFRESVLPFQWSVCFPGRSLRARYLYNVSNEAARRTIFGRRFDAQAVAFDAA